MVMAAADSGGGPGPDLYRQLGVPHGSLPPRGPADRDEEIALALLAGLALRRLARYGDSPW
jgi:hypothetical protein